MKCPKCGYLGFESSDRCRNCGYDFSLTAPTPSAPEVLIQTDAPVLGPPVDLSLRDVDDVSRGASPRASAPLDLDRLIGGPAPGTPDLPLFGSEAGGDLPLVRASSRPRAPLAVRRATPQVPRARMRPPGSQSESLALEPTAMAALGIVKQKAAERCEISAGSLSRILAALLDLAIVLCVDVAVVYFTLRLCGLQVHELLRLPIVPLAGFFLILNGGYFTAFTAVGGQSIGKMALGIKVVSEEDRPVAFAYATLRALAYLASAAPLGLGFLPALFGRERRALHDRLAHTRVIKPPSP